MQPTEFEKLSDDALCRLSNTGTREAGEVLVERYARLVRCVARPFYLAGGDHEDLLQEGMIGLLKAIREYSPEKSSFQTFAARCIRYRIYDAIKQAQGKNQQVLSTALPLEHPGTDAEDPFDWLSDHESDPEALVIHRDEQRQIAAELDALLSGFEKSVLSLYLEGLSFSEMARRLHRPVKSVDNAVTRIRNKLSPRLSPRDKLS
ncbi:MAG: sigma-70 family RNA polymerase sigma factor [Clostridiaceae bacterium]|nr:sigma-70 family RNA polymerase sigma factor [Clostridiaceae bacterium]